jgi:hypothetical protein
MAEDNKKPKIDLRARLGKKTVGAGGPSIPPPMATGSSIPAPPFASKPPPMMEPERPRIVEPQAIKIEMSEEVVQAQKKGRSKVIMIAAATAVVGGVIGVAFGGGMERRARQDMALEGAKLLSADIDKANLEINKLSEVLGEAKRALSDGEFPEDAMKKLSEVSIPFDGTYLAGKGTGLMSPIINKQLVDFAGKSSAANEQKDTLNLVLSAAQPQIKELLEQQDKPKFNWSVYMMNGPHGPMARMQPIPEPFLVTSKEKKDGKDYAWPVEIEVPDGDKKVKLKLYKDGSPVATDPLLVPVDPSSQGAVCPSDTMVRLRGEIIKLEELLKGDKSDPTNEKEGLVDLGQKLIDQLKGIGG